MGSPSIIGDEYQPPRRGRRSSSLAEYRPRCRDMTAELRRRRMAVNRVGAMRFATCRTRPVTFAREALLCARLKRNGFRLSRPFALACYLSMIFSENRYPLFGIML